MPGKKQTDFKPNASDTTDRPLERTACPLSADAYAELLALLNARPRPAPRLQASLQTPPAESEIVYGMKTTTYVRKETDPLDDVVAMLAGHVFHATRRSSYDRILACGEIKPNRAGTLPKGFGYANGFFRRRNCVSLFDYRPRPTPDILEFRRRCSPFQLAEPGGEEAAILIFKPEIETRLIPWTLWCGEQAWRDVVVPYVEVGHLGPIGIDMVSEVVFFKCIEDPTSFAALLRSAYQERAGSM
jgi:hypothetical protein